MNEYDEGYDTGARFRVMEQGGWDPGNTYLATMINHQGETDWLAGFEDGVMGNQKGWRNA